MFGGMLRRPHLAIALLVALVTPLAARPSHAAPIEASGTASAAAADDARELAIIAARRAALEQALEAMELEPDEIALAQVRERPEAWTSAYRLLSISDADGMIEARVEVEIDLPRLRKRIAKRSGPRPRGFDFGGLQVQDCGSVDEAALTQPLRTYGILADGGSGSLALTLSCEQRGLVPHTHTQAVASSLRAVVRGEFDLEVEVRSQGFAANVEQATKVALERAIGELADELAVVARGELELRVEQPWPSSRLSTLERTLRDEVIGVELVELAGIADDGSALLRIGGSIEAKGLARALQDTSFSGFGLVGLRVDGAHALSVRMQ